MDNYNNNEETSGLKTDHMKDNAVTSHGSVAMRRWPMIRSRLVYLFDVKGNLIQIPAIAILNILLPTYKKVYGQWPRIVFLFAAKLTEMKTKTKNIIINRLSIASTCSAFGNMFIVRQTDTFPGMSQGRFSLRQINNGHLIHHWWIVCLVLNSRTLVQLSLFTLVAGESSFTRAMRKLMRKIKQNLYGF